MSTAPHPSAHAAAPLVLITGAGSGIGLALARHYAAQGARLALVGRRAASIESAASAGGLCESCYQIYESDVADADAMQALALACQQRQGLPDVVVANAGISHGIDGAQRADLDVLARIMATNVLGLAHTLSPFMTPMVQRGRGTLVGVASVAGVRGLPGHGAYCASKAAAITYLESLRGDLRGSGVRVVTLVPGYIATPLTANNAYRMPFLMQPDAFAAQAAAAIAQGDSYRVIPWQMAWVAKLLRVLPNAVFDWALAGRPRKPRQGQAGDVG